MGADPGAQAPSRWSVGPAPCCRDIGGAIEAAQAGFPRCSHTLLLLPQLLSATCHLPLAAWTAKGAEKGCHQMPEGHCCHIRVTMV